MSSKPEFIIVPGAWHVSPGVEAIKVVICTILAAGKDVVVVHHSHCGVPGSEALKEYLSGIKDARGDEVRGNVRRLIPVLLYSLTSLSSPNSHTNNLHMATPSFPLVPRKSFTTNISTATRRPYIKALQPQASPTFSSALTIAPWKSILSTYLLCAEDEMISLRGKEGMVAASKGATPDAFDVVERCEAGHCSFISQLEWLTGRLIKIAGGGVCETSVERLIVKSG